MEATLKMVTPGGEETSATLDGWLQEQIDHVCAASGLSPAHAALKVLRIGAAHGLREGVTADLMALVPPEQPS